MWIFVWVEETSLEYRETHKTFSGIHVDHSPHKNLHETYRVMNSAAKPLDADYFPQTQISGSVFNSN